MTWSPIGTSHKVASCDACDYFIDNVDCSCEFYLILADILQPAVRKPRDADFRFTIYKRSSGEFNLDDPPSPNP